MRPCVALLILLAAPSAVAAPSTVRLAVLPVEGINLPAAEGDALRARLEQILRRNPTARVAPSPRAVACGGEIACLQQTGVRLGLDKMVALRVGRLGDTTALRLTVFDVPRGVRQGIWQEVLRRADDAGVTAALERMVVSFLPLPPAPQRRAWYTRWWVWTIAGAVVAGSVTAAVVLATRPGEGYDLRVRP
jgi:hypothetical protein